MNGIDAAAVRAGPIRHQSGFTLMEVLIAVTITAVIGVGVWQVISSVINSRDRVDAASEQFGRIQRAFVLLERDLTQLVNRPIRNIYGDSEPAISNRSEEFDLVVTRQGWSNPFPERRAPRSSLQRVAYEFTGEELRRRYWLTVDQGQEDTSQDLLLAANVKTFDIEFLDADGNWVPDWPTQEALNNVTGNSVGQLPTPIGVRVSLEHERFGQLSRLYVLPQFDQVAVQQTIQQQGELSTDESADEPEEGEQSGEQPTGGS